MVIAVALLFALPALADDYKIGELEIDQPWARATPGGVKNGAAYLTLRNGGQNLDRLIAVESTAAKRVGLHNSVEENGVMKMRSLEAIDVPPDGTAMLAPGGMHIMLMGLNAPMVEEIGRAHV